MKTKRILLGALPGLVLALILCTGCPKPPTDNPGGKKPSDFPQISADVFKPMDGGLQLSPDEIKGRNEWNLWTAGNEAFWDRMAMESFGMMDLLKTLDSRKRPSRFKETGLINEPGFRPAGKPDEHGMWLDERVEPEPAGINPAVHGKSSGVLGFRLFPNPQFDEAARKRWDPQRYYTDRAYYDDPKLIRPYRVGVSCGSCHIAFHPNFPPADPENPKWENLASLIGNQYIREGKVFANNVKPGRFFSEMLGVQPPGTSDTSRLATDHINNPNSINPIFNLDARLTVTTEEKMAGGTLNLPGQQELMKVPHILKDGADSIGVPGTTIRVFVNIGMFSQHWLQQHNVLIGLGSQQPFHIATARKHSVFWLATEERLANIAAFFKRIKPYHLKDAPNGTDHISKDEAVLTRGKIVFAESCAKCHSSKRPPAGLNINSEEADKWFRDEVQKPDFLDNNFLSDDQRYPVTRIKTNPSRAFASNAKRGHIWDNFSSETYKTLPSVGEIEYYNPYTGQKERFTAPDGGSGYYRTPSLVSLWSSAPFLHNNALGIYTGDPSVAGRMKAFNDAAEKLLWPEKRLGTNSIWRTSDTSYLEIPESVIPPITRKVLKRREVIQDGVLRLGPIPKGTPINLLGNLNPDSDKGDLAVVALEIKKALVEERVRNLDEEGMRKLMREEVAPLLMKVSACPDFIEDEGHDFGTELPDSDKRALIEFMKTF